MCVQRQLQFELVVHLPPTPVPVNPVEACTRPANAQLLHNLALHLPAGVLHDVAPPIAALAVLECSSSGALHSLGFERRAASP